jgi:hypothetical protein
MVLEGCAAGQGEDGVEEGFEFGAGRGGGREVLSFQDGLTVKDLTICALAACLIGFL